VHDNNSGGATSINSGFTKIDDIAWNGSSNEGRDASLIQTSAAA
jgi:hypothetical protein